MTALDSSIGQEPAGQQAAPPAPRQRSLFFNRDYMLLWSGQLVSSFGTQISGIAFPILILALTHNNAADAGYAIALRALPYVFFSLPAGALIDRWNRKLVMILCDSGRALALGSIGVALFLGHLTLTQIYIVALVEGTLFVFFNIAEVACLPHVVAKTQLPGATAQNSATDGVSLLVGPPLGGALYGLSHMVPFLSDAISYVVSVVSLFFIRASFQNERTVERRKLWVEIGEGLGWLWRHPLIRFMAFLTGSLNFVGGGAFLILIVIATNQGATPTQIGLILTIAAVGGIIGSILGGAIQKRFSFGQVIIGTVWLQTLVFPLLLLAPSFVWLGVISAVLFLAGPIYNVVQFSYRVALIPDALQGRVNSAFRLLAFGFQPLGGALTGLMLFYWHATATVLAFFGVQLVVATVTALAGTIRHARPITEAHTLA